MLREYHTSEKMNESERLEEISLRSKYAFGVNYYSIVHSASIFKKYMKMGGVLELGPAEGVMTDLLVKGLDDYTVVDGAEKFVSSITQKYPWIKGHVSLFEDYNPDRQFSNIIMGHVLEHVEEPIDILLKASSWLEKDGILMCAVPNSMSIHRQAAVMMGLLSKCNELNENDIFHGHRRVYNRAELKSDFEKAGFNILVHGGYWLKPLSNGQIEESWTDSMIEAFMRLGEQYPDIAAEQYIIATI